MENYTMMTNKYFQKVGGCPFKVHPISNGMKGAFTLVELLVVIAILCLLFALLFPIVMTSRDYAKRIICINNLRNISLALGAYASDFQLKLPGYYWYQKNKYTNDDLSSLYPDYISVFGVFECPATDNIVENIKDLTHSARSRSGRGISFEYKNAKCIEWGKTFGVRSPLLFDIDSRGRNRIIDADDNHVKLQGGNMLMTDGRVEWVKAKEWRSVFKYYDPRP
jgi:prepilin-type N-terminal cleavage/methylation domain-containing protein